MNPTVFVLTAVEDHDYDRDVSVLTEVFSSREEAEAAAESVLREDWDLAEENDHPGEVFGFRFGSFEEYRDWSFETGRTVVEEREVHDRAF